MAEVDFDVEVEADVDFDVDVVAEAVVELVAVDVAVAVAVAVDVAVGELEVSSATSCVPISVSNVNLYRLVITFRTAFTEALLVIVHLIGRSAVAVAMYAE
uniref:Uncharacterized protein n=1 Tax=viral metagenome TaxID=1070528 RepID=A0A6M3JTU9_9ZZZZ